MDVLIIGAGYTGLACAYHLLSKRMTVNVLEASERVGGRALDCDLNGKMQLELGGQYISPDQLRITQLLKELKMETFPAYGSGNSFLFLNNQITSYQSSPIKCFPDAVRNEIETGLKELATLYPEVPSALPWTHRRGEDWDALTFQSWIDKTFKTDEAKQFFRLMTNQGFSTEPEQISLLQMLWFLKTSHGIPAWALGEGQANRIVGGPHKVAERLAEQLGDRIRYKEKVIAIEEKAGKIQVLTQKSSYQAQVVVVCVPPQLITSIQYTPSLPSNLFRAFSAFQTGNAMKVQAVYSKPFWREKGWSGNGIVFNGIPAFTYDNSGPEGAPGVLLGFLSARNATLWNEKTQEERKAAILQTWAQIFGEEALQPRKYIEQDWMNDPFIRGGHGCHFPPGFWCELGPALGGEHLPRHGKVLWAASDLSKDWNGYLEGALFAGEQAAKEVVKVLSEREFHVPIF